METLANLIRAFGALVVDAAPSPRDRANTQPRRCARMWLLKTPPNHPLTELDLTLIEIQCDRMARDGLASDVRALLNNTRKLIREVKDLRGQLCELLKERAIDMERANLAPHIDDILAVRKEIEDRSGPLPESWPLIREDRDR